MCCCKIVFNKIVDLNRNFTVSYVKNDIFCGIVLKRQHTISSIIYDNHARCVPYLLYKYGLARDAYVGTGWVWVGPTFTPFAVPSRQLLSDHIYHIRYARKMRERRMLIPTIPKSPPYDKNWWNSVNLNKSIFSEIFEKFKFEFPANNWFSRSGI